MNRRHGGLDREASHRTMEPANAKAGGAPPSQPLKSALKMDDDAERTPPASCQLKAVQIAEPVEEIPLSHDHDAQCTCNVRQFRAGSSRRLSGRFSSTASISSLSEASPALRPADESSSSSASRKPHRQQYYSEKLLAQVGEWLERERTKVKNRKHKSSHRAKAKATALNAQQAEQEGTTEAGRPRSDSVDSQSSDVSLDRLQRILEDSMASFGLSSLPTPSSKPPRQGLPAAKRRGSLHRAYSSDTEYADGDVIVPSCDAWLDNTKTLAYGAAAGNASTDDLAGLKAMGEAEREAWSVFKNEILRITHTLRLKGWRRIPLGSGEGLAVERLSGALTNAVYVVTPPSGTPDPGGKKPPAKLLLRIYGPQVEHLIDRENELQVLQRLARKKIGPRLFGTFRNGRFEQYFNAITLTATDIREASMSRQLARRMRELHDGIDLLPSEREGGPCVRKNWDCWKDNVARISTYLDNLLQERRDPVPSSTSVHAWMANGHVLGAPWPLFKETVDKYWAYLYGFYKDRHEVNKHLVFAHNDTQYGNILRVRPDDEKSPLLQPANQHKQLIVIDFEYAGANVPGLEFANHFTEWTYNYHNPLKSWACDTRQYPCVEEQRRFVKAYVDHRPQFPHASLTPKLVARDSSSSMASTPGAATTPKLIPSMSSSSIVDFMLDSRAPPGGWSAAEKAREEQTEQQVRDLIDETKRWRAANSIMWVAWGVVQAMVPGLETPPTLSPGADTVAVVDADPPAAPAAREEDREIGPDEFDYLRYSQDRAYFFWGDMVRMGIVKLEELPDKLRSNLRVLDY